MLLKLTHATDLTYTDLISESVMELRMAPWQEEDQHRLSFTLGIGPPAPALSYFDWLGNIVHAFTVNSFHKQIRIVATSVVETDRSRIVVADLPDIWPLAPEGLDYEMFDFLEFGGPIMDAPALRQLAKDLDPQPGERLADLSMRMLDLLASQYTFQKGITTAASPITDILEKRSGVCQDFTHLMIGLGRTLRIPARYVSGMLHPQAERFRGFTQTHAWCEFYFPSTGWVGFDAANHCNVGDNFVKVAVGRNFGDVPPNKGLYRGKSNESIDVQVHSEELLEMPTELASERVESLPVATFAAGTAMPRELATYQQGAQQQQQRQ